MKKKNMIPLVINSINNSFEISLKFYDTQECIPRAK